MQGQEVTFENYTSASIFGLSSLMMYSFGQHVWRCPPDALGTAADVTRAQKPSLLHDSKISSYSSAQ